MREAVRPLDPAGPFRAEQRRVALGMAASVAVSAATLILLLALQPFALPGLDTPAARLVYAIRLDALPLACLGLAIANVARLRFFSATDIGGSAQDDTGPAVLRGRAILQNTLEQAVFAVGSHCALAVQLPPRWVGVLPGLVFLFCAGRVLFWLGYCHGAAGRAFGFGLTFYPTVGACAAAIALLIR